MFGRGLEARERRVIAWGAGIATLALLATFVVLPAYRRWSDRESAIDAAQGRVARLLRLSDQGPQLVAAAAERGSGGARGTGLLRGRTAALAGSSLQSLLQDAARLSRVSVSRLEVASPTDSAVSPERGLVATLAAVSDVYGVADLLDRLQAGPVLLSVDEVSVAPNPVLRGNLLQLSLTVRAPFVVEP